MVIAADRHAHRLHAMRAQFKRLGLRGVHLVELDATQPLPFLSPFARILVDAPCSGTGTLARHPEIRWRLRPEQLAEFHRLQVQLLRMALVQLAPGGTLVYSTCSIEPEENEHVVEAALRDAPSIRRATPSETARTLAAHLAPGISASALLDDAGQFRTFPGQHHTDGFFAAPLVRLR
jgi:16S rRNA (cytosine967-C5)-methyltransferase